MNANELRTALEAKRVPRQRYSLMVGGFPGDCYCLVQDGEGYEVYFSERGLKSRTWSFATEADACEFMLGKLERFARN